MNNLVALGLIISEQDLDKFPLWFNIHNIYFNKIYVAVDGNDSSIKSFASDRVEIFQYLLNNDFAAMRNSIVEKNVCDKLLMLDADEILLPDLVEELPKLVQSNFDIVGFSRINITNNQMLDNYPDIQFRLINQGVKWVNNSPYRGASPGCHETPESTDGQIGYSKTNILHYKYNFTGNFRNKGYKDVNSK